MRPHLVVDKPCEMFKCAGLHPGVISSNIKNKAWLTNMHSITVNAFDAASICIAIARVVPFSYVAIWLGVFVYGGVFVRYRCLAHAPTDTNSIYMLCASSIA